MKRLIYPPESEVRLRVFFWSLPKIAIHVKTAMFSLTGHSHICCQCICAQPGHSFLYCITVMCVCVCVCVCSFRFSSCAVKRVGWSHSQFQGGKSKRWVKCVIQMVSSGSQTTANLNRSAAVVQSLTYSYFPGCLKKKLPWETILHVEFLK